MNIFHVNLPLSYAAREPRYIDLFIEHGLNPELDIDLAAFETLDMAWHRATADRLHQAGLCCAVHLPFQDLHPGSPDRLIREATATRLAMAFDIAEIYAPTHLIGHAMYSNWLYNGLHDAWLDASTLTWNTLLALWPNHPPLYLENVYETAPESLAELVSRITEGPCGVCFDIGHWHAFGNGVAKGDIDHWVDTLAPHLRHLHLHDNDGSSDQHLGPGAGSIPFDAVLAALARNDLHPSVTFEPHDEDALTLVLTFARNTPALFAPAD
ncbi:sugar phosphate isomerase/epimerase [Desulfobaculum xiamenense]|uniref:Sugar phosphate isomerase/epimerase n=1 Tax=Desulfobaculum xiamenense TaxID=995050 RepID=A0A846QTS5_9BACT|nr:TIM barrel protein [Desulfobaculum xiamenense]NJB68039.1 sugar phosphate isomerase/epimerase [Desulfobaculum xiamenense]